MDEAVKEYIKDFFSKRLLHFGDTPASLGWTETGQQLRYEYITGLLPLDNSSILDFGCGKGDLYSYLSSKGFRIDYTGVDINPDLIRLAKKKFPETKFYTLDIDEEDIKEEFDFIIICGVFNLNIKGVKDSAFRSIKRLFLNTKKALLFNCPSIYSRRKDLTLLYYDPVEVLSLALSITENVNLYHNLIEGEIFLILAREG
jgi:SAM-dependent methyltransferase